LRNLFTLFSLLLPAMNAFSQTDTLSQRKLAGFGIEVSPFAGKVIKQDIRFTLPIPALSTGLDVNFVWQTYGRKPWHQGRNFPAVGVGITYLDYGMNNVYGKSVGVFPNLLIPIMRRDKWEWTMRIGDGIGYISKKYQNKPPYDTVNTAIGTHINDFGNFFTDFRYHYNRHWDLQAGANFTHMSNGLYRSPNLGVNVLGAHLAFRYFPETSSPKHILREQLNPKNRWLTEIHVGIAYNEARTTDSPEVPTYCYQMAESLRWLGKNKLYAGVNYVYKTSVYDFLKHYGVDYGHEMGHSWNGAFFLGNEFLVGRVGIVVEGGMYYHQTYLAFVPYYERFGGKLYLLQRETGLLKELSMSILLTAHGIVAEYAEFGIGAGIF